MLCFWVAECFQFDLIYASLDVDTFSCVSYSFEIKTRISVGTFTYSVVALHVALYSYVKLQEVPSSTI